MDAATFTRDPLRRVRDVVMPNPFGSVTVPLPLYVGPDCRAVYVLWQHNIVEIAPLGDGTFLPYANTTITSEPLMPGTTSIPPTTPGAAPFTFCVEFRANGTAIDVRRVEAEDHDQALHKALAIATAKLASQGRTLAYEFAHVSIRNDIDRR